MKNKLSFLILLIFTVLFIRGFSLSHEAGATEIRGLCVGGLNHNLPCGSSKDCPEKKYTDSAEDTVEYGVCVGSALDTGKTIPKSEIGRAYERLGELFVQGFNSWVWDSNQGSYKPHLTQTAPYDDSGSVITKPDSDKANIKPTPPQIFSLSLKDPNNPLAGFTWGSSGFSVMKENEPKDSISVSGSSFTAVLRFFALADNDQMPIVRMAVDWDDGPDDPNTPAIERQNIYEVKGWFKNRKPWCETEGWKVCDYGADLNRPCNNFADCGSNDPTICASPSASDNRLHFGNSSNPNNLKDIPAACQPGYYQFTHIYTCKENGPGWDAVSKSCKFKPKVQVLDNWGWCNGTCRTVGGSTGCWDDSKLVGTKDELEQECNTQNNKPHWTSFGGVIEIKP